MNQVTYSQKLQRPEWQYRRLEILTRDRLTCQLCGDKETQLHIHHKYYMHGSEPWEYPDDALITYCKHCHYATELMQIDGQVPIIARRSKTTTGFSILSVVFQEENNFSVNIFLCERDEAKVSFIITIREERLIDLSDLINEAKNLI